MLSHSASRRVRRDGRPAHHQPDGEQGQIAHAKRKHRGAARRQRAPLLREPAHQPAAERHEDDRQHLEQHHVVKPRRQHVVLAPRQVHGHAAADGERRCNRHQHLQRLRPLAQRGRIALVGGLGGADDARDGHQRQREQEPLRDRVRERADAAEQKIAHDGHHERRIEVERGALGPRSVDGRRPDDDDPPARKPQQGARHVEQPHVHHRQHRHERERGSQRRRHADRRYPQSRFREPARPQQRPRQQMRRDDRCDDHEEEHGQLRRRAINPDRVHRPDDHMRREEVQHPDSCVQHRRADEQRGASFGIGPPLFRDSPSMDAMPWCQYK